MKLPYIIVRGTPGRDMFPPHLEPDEDGLVALGGPLNAETVLEAYGKGIFPWTGRPPVPWYSPNPRLVLVPSEFHASRSLRKLARKGIYEVRFDTDFLGVMRACAEMPREGQNGTWITRNMVRAMTELFERGITHCVETLRDGEVVGGLYGLSLGRAFFGESMFALEPNASKLALYALCHQLAAWDFALIDCQQVTRHLTSLGARPWPRREFLNRLAEATAAPTRHGPWTAPDLRQIAL